MTPEFVTIQMKALMVLCVLVLKRLHLLAILCLTWTEKHSSARIKHGISRLTCLKQEASDAQIKSLLTKGPSGEELADPAVIDKLLRDREANRPQLDRKLGGNSNAVMLSYLVYLGESRFRCEGI